MYELISQKEDTERPVFCVGRAVSVEIPRWKILLGPYRTVENEINWCLRSQDIAHWKF